MEVVEVLSLLTQAESRSLDTQGFLDTVSVVHLHQVLVLAMKLNALITVNNALASILYVNSDACGQALDQFFAAVPSLRPVLDVRNVPHLSVVLVTNDIPNIPVFINFACLVSISLIFNQPFLQVVRSLSADVSPQLAVGMKSVNKVLIRVAVILQSVLFSVVGLSSETLRHMTGDMMYPTLSQVAVIYPTLRRLQFLKGVLGLTSSMEVPVSVPSPELASALPLYQLLNSLY